MREEISHQGFLSMVKDRLNKGLRIVNIRSRETVDALKVKRNIVSSRKKRGRLILELGEFTFSMFQQKGEFDEAQLRDKCKEIARIDQEISDLEKQLELIHENARKQLGELKAISKPATQNEEYESPKEG